MRIEMNGGSGDAVKEKENVIKLPKESGLKNYLGGGEDGTDVFTPSGKRE